MVDVVDAVLEAEAGDDAAGRAVVDAGVDAEAGDDAAGTVRVDVLVNTIVDSEAEAKGEPANDAEGDGAGLPELTGLPLQFFRSSLGTPSPPLFRAEIAAYLPCAARCAGSFSKLWPAWTTT